MTMACRTWHAVRSAIFFVCWILLVLYALNVTLPALAVIGGCLLATAAPTIFFNPRIHQSDLLLRLLVVICAVAMVAVSMKSSISPFVQLLIGLVGVLVVVSTLGMKPLTALQGLTAWSLTTLVVIALLVQGWLFFVPLAIGLFVSAATLKVSRNGFATLAAVLAVASAAHLSRAMAADETSRLFITYDQLYRASLGVSLTHWGWTDWNALSGTGIRYHWLSEAVSGWIAQVTNMDPFLVIAGLWPTLLTFGSIAALSTYLAVMGIRSVARTTTFIVVGLSYTFEFSSVGTVLGALLMIAFVAVAKELSSLTPASGRHIRHWTYAAVLLALVPMAQATTGILTIGIASGILLELILQRQRMRWWFAVVTLAGLGTAALYSQTLLKAGSYGISKTSISLSLDLPASLPDFLQILDRLPIVYSIANVWWLIWGAVSLSVIHLFVCSSVSTLTVAWSAVVTSTAFVSWVHIGGFETRMIGEAGLLITVLLLGQLLQLLYNLRRGVLFVTLVFVVAIAWRILAPTVFGAEWLQRIEGLVPVWFALLLALLVALGLQGWVYSAHSMRNVLLGLLAVLVLIGGGFQSQRRIDLMTRKAFDLATQLRGSGTLSCLTWISRNTETSTIVASNMWRLPNSDVQKYYLVSTYTKRRVLIDGPEYVTNAGMSTRRDIEHLKNLIDASVERPSIPLLRELASRGANYLIVDRSRTPLSRVDWFTTTLIATPECSVHRLPALT
jgi:hypothetical protein